MITEHGRIADGDRAVAANAVEPVPVSPVPASIPCAWWAAQEQIISAFAPFYDHSIESEDSDA